MSVVFFCFVFFSLLASLIPETQGQCRNLRFTSALIHGHRLNNHMIRTIGVMNEDFCELQCYMEPNCVSYNFNRKKEANGQHKCDLNNATYEHDNEQSGDLAKNESFIYRGAENACTGKPCQNNSTCQAGFTDRDYQCLCMSGFTGHDCENDIDECASATHNCSDNAVCNNSRGSYNCTCKDGFHGDGITCTVKPLSVIICEGKKGVISCQNGKIIDVLNANYGRLDRETCPDHRINCRSRNSLKRVQDKCNGKSNCELHASNSVFGDPCPGTYKYLEVKYRCLEYINLVPDPVALYPLDGAHGAKEISNRVGEGVASGVQTAPGPDGKPDGSYEFSGTVNSYIEFPKGGVLDVQNSMTMLCWLYPGSQNGPLFNYGKSERWGVHLWVWGGQLSVRFIKRDYLWTQQLLHTSLKPGDGWKFVGASYDQANGHANLWVDGKAVQTVNIGANLQLATQDNVTMGVMIGDTHARRYLNGRIAQMQVYNVALTQEQIKLIKDRT